MRLRSIMAQGLWASLAMLAVADQKPNILFILTDDQDWHMESLVPPSLVAPTQKLC